MLWSILVAVTIGSIFSLAGGFLLLFRRTLQEGLAILLTSFAAGVLLATAFLDLLPEAVQTKNPAASVFPWMLGGLVVFFFLEKLLLWYHHHHQAHGKIKPAVWLVTVGDSLHNFIDGVAIAASFLTSTPLGIATTIAVGAHEIPQELSDFSLLLSHGLGRKRTVIFNLLSALTAIVGALVTYFAASLLQPYLPNLIAFTAGMFTYIAASDLIPELHSAPPSKRSLLSQSLTFAAGIIVVWVMKAVISA